MSRLTAIEVTGNVNFLHPSRVILRHTFLPSIPGRRYRVGKLLIFRSVRSRGCIAVGA